jgi:hypothetical protein
VYQEPRGMALETYVQKSVSRAIGYVAHSMWDI